jgi:hypothetical protein
MNSDADLLKSIDAKLGGILAVLVDLYLRETDIARPKVRSIDQLLTDSGLTAGQTADLLGKTKRAVNMQLQAERQGGKSSNKGK